jgi:glutamine amidotransferase
MQLMTQSSEEGELDGLGWIEAESKRFVSKSLKVPHMGWNIIYNQKESKLFTPTDDEERFYFVHSYYVSCNDREDILTTTSYGHNFVSSFEKENIVGVQFHPEKSHKFGMRLFKNFVERY